MLQYALKRFLLMPPTFFMISMIIFLVLNIAPGRPGEVGQGTTGQSAGGNAQAESYRIFKRQFNLDKPILLNTRFALREATVRRWLVEANDLDHRQRAAARIHAQEKLEDVGNDLVRHLVVIVAADADLDVRRAAALVLTQAAQQRYVEEGEPDVIRARNNAIAAENHGIERLFWKADDAPARVAEVTAAWQAWWTTHAEAFEYTTGEAARGLLLDTRFAKYWSNIVRLDFGVSTVDRRPVMPTIVSKVRYSLSITFLSILLAYAVAVPIGVFSAVRRGALADNAMTVALFVLYSLPTFFTGTVLLRWLSEGDPLALFPTGGFQSHDQLARTTLESLTDIAWHLVLPILTYTSVTLAALSRYARAGVIDVINADYVRTARAKGLSEAVVIIKHAARNGMIPILTLLGGLLPMLVGGSVVIEVIFGIPGMGLFLFDSINLRDYNAVMGVLLVSSVLTLFGIFLSDMSYAIVDPRISLD